LEEVESMLTRYFGENDAQIRDVDFVIDVAAVANLVQPETDKLLGKL
jgi:predicted P-loop ATPase